MNTIKFFLFLILAINTGTLFARGGDDVGNGGFAYKQSVNILKLAASALEDKIRISTLKDIVDFPNRRIILQGTLGYNDLDKLSKINRSRGGRKLAMDYIVNPATVIVLKPYFEAFAGKTDTELEDASLEVQKRLLHEAAHIWGYKEDQSETFAIAFLANVRGEDTRPSNDISIGDFCSCLKRKSDAINDCDNFCRTVPFSDQPILYVNTIIGAATTANSKLGNLYNWCTAQLSSDVTTPQCMLRATDGTDTFDLSVTVKPGSNSLTANISGLKKDQTYLLKLVEVKTGSAAQTKEFQLRRKTAPIPGGDLGPLSIMPINQYTCLVFGGKVDTNGNVIRENYVRQFYYYPGIQTPAPLPPMPGNNISLKICHDEQMNPGDDSAMYNRLEMIPSHMISWDKNDIRFMEETGKMRINRLLEQRLFDEFGINANLQLFSLVSFPSSANANMTSLGYVMVPFINNVSGKAFCPSKTDYSGNNPILNVLGGYMDDTEGLYIAEKEAEIIREGNNYRTVYGTMFVTEEILKNNGFYVENGLKIKATPQSFHTKTIFYYWPLSKIQDPTTQGSRKLFTVKSPSQMNGNVPVGIPVSIGTSDQRVGCVPKGVY